MTVDAVLIAGPTASGKSGAAVVLAEAIGGIVVNADSMQVYRELRILTARPPDAELARAPHLLYGHVSVRDALFDRALSTAMRRMLWNKRVQMGSAPDLHRRHRDSISRR